MALYVGVLARVHMSSYKIYTRCYFSHDSSSQSLELIIYKIGRQILD
jgi:hypothetical protein